jgi:phosphate transport system substrate-binding protein
MRAAAALLAAATLLLAAAAPARAAPTISMSGEQVTEDLVADLAYFYRHHVRHPPRFELAGGGTSAGIADTVRGVTDGALVSRPLERDDPRGLVLTPLAVSGLCLVTNKANPVAGLSRAQLQDIVAGRVTSWSQVPGSPRTDAIVPIDLGLTTGAGRVFQSVFVDPSTPIAWRALSFLTTEQARDYIAQTPAAFGYVDLSFTRQVHVVAWQGVGCRRATIASGAYPARRPLGVVTRGRPRGALKRFLRWTRTSRIARRVIATRYLPR